MHVEVRTRGFQLSLALREHVIRRVEFALDRFAGKVNFVRVRLEDVNGPRGGPDKRCRIGVSGPAFGLVYAEALSLDLYAAVDAAAERAGRGLSRTLDRQHTRFVAPRVPPLRVVAHP